jgi:protein-L-isoaspartate(D-aspartate) O-methyltransferase
MDAALASLVDARNYMVDGQLRPNKVTDRRILDAMRRLPRELFVPPAQTALAYADVEVPLGGGRVLLAPVTVARLIQAAAVPTGGSVLVLGAGYAAAVLASCGARVTAVEPDPTVRAAAKVAWRACGIAVAVMAGPFEAGWAAASPYDAILADGALRDLPPLAGQLRVAPAGRLCAVLAPDGRSGVAVLAERAGEGLAQRTLFDCTASLLPHVLSPEPFRF